MSTYQPVPTTTEEVMDEEAPKPERSLREKGIENIMSYGVSPEGAILFCETLVNMQLFAFIGVAFAILAYFFYDGSYLGMFGLYLAYDIDHLDRILYEFIVLLPADVSFFRGLREYGGYIALSSRRSLLSFDGYDS
jgi:hypothetical protein